VRDKHHDGKEKSSPEDFKEDLCTTEEACDGSVGDENTGDKEVGIKKAGAEKVGRDDYSQR